MVTSDAKLAFMKVIPFRLEVIKLRPSFQKCPLGTTGRIICHRLGKLQHRSFQTSASVSVLPSLPASTQIQWRSSLDSRIDGNRRETISLPQCDLDFDAREKLLLSLRRRDPELALRSLLSLSKQKDILNSIPNTTFSEILRLLNPSFFVEPYNKIYERLSKASVKLLRIPALYIKFRDFIKDIKSVVELRKAGGKSLGVNDYSRLLECARAVGSVPTAEGLWRDMQADGVQPNTTCYNHFMAVKCFPVVSDPLHRHKARVIPHNIEMRSRKARPKAFTDYNVGTGGVRSQLMELYDEMVSNGLGEGDADTFCFLMIAMGREGDIPGVKAVLRKVWGVDVDALIEGGQESLSPLNRVGEDSPLYPGEYLLWTMAHIFGSNNDIPTALRVVDFISLQYSIEIPTNVWEHLLEWTFVLVIPRYGAARQNGTLTGKLPLKSVGSLWETMVAEPYNVKPTMDMYNKYIKTCFLQAQYERAQGLMREAALAHRESIMNDGDAELATERYLLTKSLRPPDNSRIPDRDASVTEMELARVETSYNHWLIRRWVRYLIRGTRKADRERMAPEILREWAPFLPEKAFFMTTGGFVSIKTGVKISRKTEEEIT